MSPIQVNFGCGNTKKPGFVNVDIRPSSAADVVAEAWDVSAFATGSVDLVYSRHMLEHLDPMDARRTLRAWHDILKPDGILNVIVPDIVFHAKQLLGVAQGPFPDQEAHAFAGFWGWRDEARGGDREDVHRWGYTVDTLKDELVQAGFSGVVRQLTGTDSEAWHLNIIAIKPSF
jgi:predicted SAM-dependent methyltransferase